MILQRLRELYPQLTKSQKVLADFVASHYREAAFMTASALANRLDLNEATVIRFAQRIGYPGYPEFIQDVQNIVASELGAGRVGDDEHPCDPYVDVLRAEMDNLHYTASHITPDLLREAVKVIDQARRIYVFGEGTAGPIAQLLAKSLATIGYGASALSADPLDLALMLDLSDAGSLLIALSVDWETELFASVLTRGRELGAHTLALTSSPISRYAQAVDLVLSYPPAEAFVFPSVTPLVLLVDTLIECLSRCATEDVGGRLARLAVVGETEFRSPDRNKKSLPPWQARET